MQFFTKASNILKYTLATYSAPLCLLVIIAAQAMAAKNENSEHCTTLGDVSGLDNAMCLINTMACLLQNNQEACASVQANCPRT